MSEVAGFVLGFSDGAGFDTLRIAAFDSLGNAAAALLNDLATNFQAVAIDNVRVQVPEPTSLLLLGAGLLGLRWARRRVA